MNDFELKARLKAVPLPERSEVYWDDFPMRVRRQLGCAAAVVDPGYHRPPQFAWRLGASFACLAIGLLLLGQPLQTTSRAIFKNEQIIRQQLAELHCHLRILMADEHGLHYLVAEKP